MLTCKRIRQNQPTRTGFLSVSKRMNRYVGVLLHWTLRNQSFKLEIRPSRP